MAKLSIYKTDPATSVEGLWFDFEAGSQTPLESPHATHICFRIARWNNPKFRAERVAVLEVSRDGVEHDAASVMRKANAKAMARAVVVDWANIDNEDGTPLAYSPEAAQVILEDDAYDQVRQFVLECATRVDLFRAQADEAAVGNSVGSSTGTSATPRSSSDS